MLTIRSLELLSLPDLQAKKIFIEERKLNPLIVTNYITCLNTVRKDPIESDNALSQIVIGSECGLVYLIDQSGSKIIQKFIMPSIPFKIISYGCLDIEYYLYVASRNNEIYIIKNNDLIDLKISISNRIFDMIRTKKSLIVACVDGSIHGYNPINFTKNFSINLPAKINCIEYLNIMTYPVFNGYMLSLKNGEFRIYDERILIYVYKFSEPMSCIKFGNYSDYGRCYILVGESGSFIVKKQKYSSLEVN
mgnify:CR=1 FL=1